MTIVDQLTPVYYRPMHLVVEIVPDETLTEGSLTFFSDIRILNKDGRQLGDDHPTPQTTPAQLAAFLAWIQSNLATYQTAVGLDRYTEVAE
jgi:hypothetical protein